MSAGDESGRQTEGPRRPAGPGDAVRNPAQVSFWLLEPATDAAMTYFYAQLFAMDTEIRAMFPAAMDVQRRRFFQALSQIAAAQESQEDRDNLVPCLQELGRAHRKFGVRERHYEVFRRALIAMLQRARRHQDLYDLAALQEMELTYPWLQVIPAVSDEPAHDHDIMYGTIRTGRQGHLGRAGHLHQRARSHDRQDRPGAAGARHAEPPHPLRPGPKGEPSRLAAQIRAEEREDALPGVLGRGLVVLKPRQRGQRRERRPSWGLMKLCPASG